MTGPAKAAAQAPDWAAVRDDYEQCGEPVWKVAERHGVTASAIDHRRRREGWFARRDIARLRQGLSTVSRANRRIDWDKIRGEYENGEFAVWEICERHGIGQNCLYRRKRRDAWQARRAGFPTAYAAGGTVNATARLKVLVERELAAIEARLGLDTESGGDPLRTLHTLASAIQKFLDIENKEKAADDADNGGRLIIGDGSRDALAQRLEALAGQWDGGETPGSA